MLWVWVWGYWGFPVSLEEYSIRKYENDLGQTFFSKFGVGFYHSPGLTVMMNVSVIRKKFVKGVNSMLG